MIDMPSQRFAPGFLSIGPDIITDVRCARVAFGALPNTTTKNVAHGIPGEEFGEVVMAFIIGKSGLTQRMFPDNQCQVSVGLTNLTMVSTADLSSFTGTGLIYYVK